MPVQGPHHADTGEQRRAAKLDHQEQSFHGGPPLLRIVLFFRQCGDVLAGIPQRHQTAAVDLVRAFIYAWKSNWVSGALQARSSRVLVPPDS